jgi:hypothetical protein
MEPSDKPILDYATPPPPPPPLRRRDSVEYYREPPNTGMAIGIVSVLLLVVLYAILVFAGMAPFPG